MDDAVYVNELADIVRDEVRLSVERMAMHHARSPIVGYALCTDDCLMTLYRAAIDAEALRKGVHDLIQVPTDWPYEDDRDLVVADARLRSHYEVSSPDQELFVRHVDLSFEGLLRGLERPRAEGTIGPDVFLIVCSTDPHPEMAAQARTALSRLNSADLLRRYGLSEG